MPILRCATVVYRFDRKRRPLADDGKNEKAIGKSLIQALKWYPSSPCAIEQNTLKKKSLRI